MILPKQAHNLQGKRFGRLKVLRYVGRDKARNILWACECDCGVVVQVSSKMLKAGDTKSCGCLRRDIAAWRMSGENHPRWAGGEFTFGSLSWARRMLVGHRRASRKGDYAAPIITPEQLSSFAKQCPPECPICERSFKNNKDRCLDHDHLTGHVRGFLCRQCNSILGLYGDDPRKFQNAINYLSSH